MIYSHSKLASMNAIGIFIFVFTSIEQTWSAKIH